MVHNVLTTTKNSILGFYDRALQGAYSRYIKVGLGLCVGAAVAAGGYMGYTWYASYKEQAAQYAFATIFEQFSSAQEAYYASLQKKEEQTAPDTEQFSTLAQQFADGYVQHAGTNIAPYFLAFQADAWLQSGNKDKALEAMDLLVKNTNNATPMAALFKTKRALLALDSGNQSRITTALDELQTLARNQDNSFRDYVLYQLGMYHWVNDDVAQAKVAWGQLVETFGGMQNTASPWASLAQEKLETVA